MTEPCDCGRPGPAYGPHDPDCIWWQRAKRTAEAIMAIGQGRSRPAPMERLTEYQAEERHRMIHAQRLK